MLTEVVAHGRVIWDLSATRDGGTIATSALDGTVRLWSRPDLGLERTLVGHLGPKVTAVAFAPDDARLASAGSDVKIWRVEDKREFETMGTPAYWPGLALSPDGVFIAESGGPAWNFAYTDLPRVTLRTSRGLVVWTTEFAMERQPEVLCFDRSGAFLLAGAKDGFLSVLDVGTGCVTKAVCAHSGRPGRPASQTINGVYVSADNKRLATSSRDDLLKVWSWPDLELCQSVSLPGTCGWVVWSPDGSRMFVVTSRRNIAIVDSGSGKVLAECRGHIDDVWSVAVSQDGRFVASGSTDGTVRLWSAGDGAELAVLRGHSDYVRSVAFSPDGRRLASGSADGTIRLWDVASGREVARLAEHRECVCGVVFSPDGERIYSKDTTGRIRIWDTERDAGVRELPEDLRGLAISIRSAEERAAELLSSWSPPSSFQTWLDHEWRPLISRRSMLTTALERARSFGRVGGAAGAMSDLFGRVAVRARDELQLASLQRSEESRRSGGSISSASAATWENLNAAQLHALAWPLVEPSARGRAYGREVEARAALVLARAKVSGGDTSAEAATVLAALAWAELACGRDQAALDAMAGAVAERSQGLIAGVAGEFERLVDALASARRSGVKAMAELEERLLAADDWFFERGAESLRHAALCRLDARIREMATKYLPRIERRIETAVRSARVEADPVVARSWAANPLKVRVAQQFL